MSSTLSDGKLVATNSSSTSTSAPTGGAGGSASGSSESVKIALILAFLMLALLVLLLWLLYCEPWDIRFCGTHPLIRASSRLSPPPTALRQDGVYEIPLAARGAFSVQMTVACCFSDSAPAQTMYAALRILSY